MKFLNLGVIELTFLHRDTRREIQINRIFFLCHGFVEANLGANQKAPSLLQEAPQNLQGSTSRFCWRKRQQTWKRRRQRQREECREECTGIREQGAVPVRNFHEPLTCLKMEYFRKPFGDFTTNSCAKEQRNDTEPFPRNFRFNSTDSETKFTLWEVF